MPGLWQALSSCRLCTAGQHEQGIDYRSHRSVPVILNPVSLSSFIPPAHLPVFYPSFFLPDPQAKIPSGSATGPRRAPEPQQLLLREGSTPDPHPAPLPPGLARSAAPPPPACCLVPPRGPLCVSACCYFHVSLGPVCSSVLEGVCTDDVWGFLAAAAAVLQFGSMARLHPRAQVEMRQLRLSLSVSETGSGGHAHIPPQVGKESQAEAGATSGLKWSGCFWGPLQPQDPGWKSL